MERAIRGVMEAGDILYCFPARLVRGCELVGYRWGLIAATLAGYR